MQDEWEGNSGYAHATGNEVPYLNYDVYKSHTMERNPVQNPVCIHITRGSGMPTMKSRVENARFPFVVNGEGCLGKIFGEG